MHVLLDKDPCQTVHVASAPFELSAVVKANGNPKVAAAPAESRAIASLLRAQRRRAVQARVHQAELDDALRSDGE
jgi:hypothetical protein